MSIRTNPGGTAVPGGDVAAFACGFSGTANEIDESSSPLGMANSLAVRLSNSLHVLALSQYRCEEKQTMFQPLVVSICVPKLGAIPVAPSGRTEI